MKIKTFEVNPLEVHCYVAIDEESHEAVIVDCGCSCESEWKDIKDYIDEEQLQVRHLLNTHLHFDHVWGNAYAYRDLGLKAEASYEDLQLYEHMDEQIRSVVGMSLPHPPLPPLGTPLTEGSKVTFGKEVMEVMATPGHTRGGLCFYDRTGGVLFAGDTMFCGSYGRTDLEGGSQTDIMLSLRRLLTLPDETRVLCGHGPETSIGREKKYCMYM